MIQSTRSTRPMLVTFILLTVAYLAVPIYLGYERYGVDAKCSAFLPCLTPGEWGDFLSGVFAPLAFLWLVAAVLIQSAELREQRNELALTRKEFELNRSVMIQQAEEAKRQAKYIEEQTNILTKEANNREKDESLQSFNMLMSKYVEYVRDNYREAIYASDGYTFRIFKEIDSDISIERCIYLQNISMSSMVGRSSGDFSIDNPNLFESLFISLYSAEELIDKLPYHSRVTWQRSGLYDLVDKFCLIIERSGQFLHLHRRVEARKARLGERTGNAEASSLSPDV